MGEMRVHLFKDDGDFVELRTPHEPLVPGEENDAIQFPAYDGESFTATHFAVWGPVRRAWRERLFSWPWRPWADYEDRLLAEGPLGVEPPSTGEEDGA